MQKKICKYLYLKGSWNKSICEANCNKAKCNLRKEILLQQAVVRDSEYDPDNPDNERDIKDESLQLR